MSAAEISGPRRVAIQIELEDGRRLEFEAGGDLPGFISEAALGIHQRERCGLISPLISSLTMLPEMETEVELRLTLRGEHIVRVLPGES